jgi:hypothetical protein
MGEKAKVLLGDKHEASSPYAEEGTKAHALAEIRARRHFGKIDADEEAREYEGWRMASKLTIDEIGEMEEHVRAYIELLQQRVDALGDFAIFFEQRMPSGVERCWGTSDSVIVSHDVVEIWDFKYGAGVAVSAVGNPQLRLYGLGALDKFGDLIATTDRIVLGIFQPRVFSNGDNWEAMSAQTLRAWRDDVARPAGELALGDDAPFGPSESACRWCPAAGICTERARVLAGEDFALPMEDPEVLTPDETGDILGRLGELRAWADAVEKSALDRAYSGSEHIPGYKVVLSGGQRTITDPDQAVDVLAGETGRDPEAFTTQKIKPLGELEKIIKADLPKVRNDKTNRLRSQTLEDVIPSYLGRTPGKPSIVPEDDGRPAINPNAQAVEDFS